MSNLGLVLSGGGARGAYQAGVLAALSHISEKMQIRNPFQIYTGVSAGAINVGLLVASPRDFVDSVNSLVDLWSNINSDQVFYADLMALSRGGLQWMTEISLGSRNKGAALRSLLSTHPLSNLLAEVCHFNEIEDKIHSGILRAVGVSALDYDSISTVTFFEGMNEVTSWERGMHRSERVTLGVQHILASSAMPMLFPPVSIGDGYYGDGCIRNQSPCGPAIYMGADKIIAVGVRRRQDTWFTYHHKEAREAPTVARVANVLMNAVMMDGLESDIQRIEQINQSYSLLSEKERQRVALREVESLWIAPSIDFSEIAAHKGGELPRMIRYLLRGPGSLDESKELMSYLLFTPSYCKQLIEVGFSDGMKEREQIEKIFLKSQEKHTVEHHLTP